MDGVSRIYTIGVWCSRHVTHWDIKLLTEKWWQISDKVLTRILHTHSWVFTDLSCLNNQMVSHFFRSTFSWWPASKYLVALLDTSEFRSRAGPLDSPCRTLGWSWITMKTLQDSHGEVSSYSVRRSDRENLKCQKDDNHLNFHFYRNDFFDRSLWFFCYFVFWFLMDIETLSGLYSFHLELFLAVWKFWDSKFHQFEIYDFISISKFSTSWRWDDPGVGIHSVIMNQYIRLSPTIQNENKSKRRNVLNWTLPRKLKNWKFFETVENAPCDGVQLLICFVLFQITTSLKKLCALNFETLSIVVMLVKYVGNKSMQHTFLSIWNDQMYI